MRSKRVVIAAVMALTFGTAQTALADNNATGSIAAVQAGPVGATPTAAASQAGASVAASVPVAVGGTGNNTAAHSVGLYRPAEGTPRITPLAASRSAARARRRQRPRVHRVRARAQAAPLKVGGNGSNNASGSTGAGAGRRRQFVQRFRRRCADWLAAGCPGFRCVGRR